MPRSPAFFCSFHPVSSPSETRFLVDPDSDPVAIRIEGKASFQNCTRVKEFVEGAISSGKRNFVIDFEACSGMDSTFLGLLAGTALELRRTDPRGSVVVCNLNERNAELVKNLGLTRLLTVDNGAAKPTSSSAASSLQETKTTDQIAAARMVLDMHKNLIEADEGNAAKFRDVMDILKQQLGED